MDNLDPDIEMMLPPQDGNTYKEENISVILSDTYNRKFLPKEEEDFIETHWSERLKDNPKLWNGSKFRLDSVSAMRNGNAIFHLGVTGYKDFLCTNYSSRAKHLKELGEIQHDDAHAYLSDPLGVGALVHTTDDYFILLRRSSFCGEAVGLLDVPGGHPEPEELVGKLPVSDIDVSSLSHAAVVHEIFDSIYREICDEVNLPKEKVTFPELLGIVRNTPSEGRPTAEFYSRCSLSSCDIKTLYDEGTQADAEETTNIIFIPMSAIATMKTSKQYSDIWRQMTASAKGCLTLFSGTALAQKYHK